MRDATLCFPIDFDNRKVVLGMKKKRFGAGKWNGFGGKVNEGETIEAAARRELFEESGISVAHNSLDKAGELTFIFPNKPEWNQLVHVFVARSWAGIPKESDEMRPQKFALHEIPFDSMWVADRQWIPLVLDGKRVRGTIVFGADDKETSSVKIEVLPDDCKFR